MLSRIYISCLAFSFGVKRNVMKVLANLGLDEHSELCLNLLEALWELLPVKSLARELALR
jgi:hypothetical protein